MSKVRGFTLFEMMIVLAIIGILAAIAIPAYQDYVSRSQVSEAVGLMAGGKTPMAEHYSDKSIWPAAAAEVMGTRVGRYTATVVMTSGMGSSSLTMQLQATMKSSGSVNRNIAEKTLTLTTSDGGKKWTCSNGATNGIDQKFLPGSCK